MTDVIRHFEEFDPIPLERLHDLLLDPDTPDADLLPYLMIDERSTHAFGPVVQIDTRRVQETMAESALMMNNVNGIARWRRHQQHRRRLATWQGPRLVSEGDSWFQYPFLLKDVIDHLWADHAVLSLGGAGHLLGEMVRQNELPAAVRAERPDAVIVSAGGNDLLGGGRVTQAIEPYDPLRPAEDYLGDTFNRFLSQAIGAYREMLVQVFAASPGTPIICHCYDHAIPRGGRWLGVPFARAGIVDPGLQARIVRAIVDRFHDAMQDMVDTVGPGNRLYLVNGRGTVAGWKDELHPDSDSYGLVADLFRTKIAEALREGAVETAGMPVVAKTGADRIARAALILAEAHSETTLLYELGRRASMDGDGQGDGGDEALETVMSASVEGAFDVFADIGARIIARLERELRDVLCGTGGDDATDRAALRNAFDVGAGALAGKLAAMLTGGVFGLSAAAAAAATPILLKRFGGAAWEEVCGAWGERLEDPDGGPDGGMVEGAARGAPSAPAVRTAGSAVPEAARRSFASTSRILTMLSPGAEGSGRAMESTGGASIDLTNARARTSVEALEQALANSSAAPDKAGLAAIARDAQSGFAKLGAEGPAAMLTGPEAGALEAVVHVDGSRPVCFIQDDTVTTAGVAMGQWAAPLGHFAEEISAVARSVGRISSSRPGVDFAGTGFAVGEGLIVTNRHVLESIAAQAVDGSWRFHGDVHIDFGNEFERDNKRVFKVTGVAFAGPDPIEYRIRFPRLDIAVLCCAIEDDPFPAGVTLEDRLSAYDRGRYAYVIGYPGRPRSFFRTGTPPAGHEYVDVINALFADTFGFKRWAPGVMLDPPGSLEGDTKGWIVNHDASTLGGNSGSLVADLASNGEHVLGVHFGGRNRDENWSHATAAIVQHINGST